MKKILLTTTALIALGIAPAAAADLAARPYTKAPAAAIAINNWTRLLPRRDGRLRPGKQLELRTLSGGFAGGTAGYNWQTGNLVFGLEVDGAWADVGATVDVIPGLASVDYTIRAMGTVRWPRRLRLRPGPPLRHRRLRLVRQPPVGNGARREHLGQPIPLRLDRRCRCRSHVRTEMVGQGRVPLSELRRPDLLRRHRSGRRSQSERST